MSSCYIQTLPGLSLASYFSQATVSANIVAVHSYDICEEFGWYVMDVTGDGHVISDGWFTGIEDV